jgi:hypothetical protein
MDRLLLVVLATLGMLSNLGSHPPQGIFWIMDGLVAVFMFLMGVRLDDALRRLELQPHWRKVQPVKPETARPETLRLS